jgi:hypothetical protein
MKYFLHQFAVAVERVEEGGEDDALGLELRIEDSGARQGCRRRRRNARPRLQTLGAGDEVLVFGRPKGGGRELLDRAQRFQIGKAPVSLVRAGRGSSW